MCCLGSSDMSAYSLSQCGQDDTEVLLGNTKGRQLQAITTDNLDGHWAFSIHQIERLRTLGGLHISNV